MNPWQMAQQLKHELEQVTWLVGSTDPVFGTNGVAVVAENPTADQIPPGFPWALVIMGGFSADEDEPDLLTQTFTIVLGANVQGDPMGELSLIGGAVADVGKSAGRGVMEVATRARAAVGNLTGADGAQVIVSSASGPATSRLGEVQHLSLDSFDVTAVCTSQLHYTSPQEADMPGAGSNNWQGTFITDRFDFLQFNVIEKSGTSPSADPTDGTSVLITTALSDAGDPFTPTSGNTYTVFAQYNARGGSTVEGSSDPIIGSYVAVTS